MIRNTPETFIKNLKLQQLGQLLCCMLPLGKIRKSVYFFGTQQRKVLMDKKHKTLKVQVAVEVDKSGSQPGYMSVADYLNQNALK